MNRRRPPATFAAIHLDAIGGVAGDMLLAALIDLGADRDRVAAALATFGDPALRLDLERVVVNGVEALHVRSLPPSGDHPHTTWPVLRARLMSAALEEPVRLFAVRVFQLLAEYEARAHGATVESVHLHEVAELDSVLDILGIGAALGSLGWPRLQCDTLPSGRGTVMTSHGALTCPVPVVRDLADRHQVPLVEIEEQGETVTPTGLAVLLASGTAFRRPAPERADAVGVGAGTRRFERRANVVRALGMDRSA